MPSLLSRSKNRPQRRRFFGRSHQNDDHRRLLDRTWAEPLLTFAIDTWHRAAEGRLSSADAVTVEGRKTLQSLGPKGGGDFCGACGTGLFYANASILLRHHRHPGATYDAPGLVPARAHIQVAERIPWMERVHELPTFDRYPPMQG